MNFLRSLFGNKQSELQKHILKVRLDNPQITANMSDDDIVVLLQQADQTLASGKPMAFHIPRHSDKHADVEDKVSSNNNNSDYEVATEYMRVGLLYEQQGRYDLAIEILNKSLPIYSRIGHQTGRALNYCNLGVAYEGLNNHQLAIEMYQKGLDIMEQTGNQRGMAMAHCNFANVFKRIKNFEQAQNHYIQALRLSEQTGDQQGVAVYNFNLGQLYRDKGEIPQAQTYLRKALELFELVGDTEKAQFTSRVLQSM